jgi:hypothetical protein
MNDPLVGDLIAARAWLLNLHAQADGARNPKLLRRVRALLGAADAVIATMTPPPPVRVARKLAHLPVPETRLMDCAPTAYGPPSHSHRTEYMTVMEAR